MDSRERFSDAWLGALAGALRDLADTASRHTGVQINSRTTATAGPSGVTVQHQGRSSQTTVHGGSVQPWGAGNRPGVGVGVGVRW